MRLYSPVTIMTCFDEETLNLVPAAAWHCSSILTASALSSTPILFSSPASIYIDRSIVHISIYGLWISIKVSEITRSLKIKIFLRFKLARFFFFFKIKRVNILWRNFEKSAKKWKMKSQDRFFFSISPKTVKRSFFWYCDWNFSFFAFFLKGGREKRWSFRTKFLKQIIIYISKYNFINLLNIKFA